MIRKWNKLFRIPCRRFCALNFKTVCRNLFIMLKCPYRIWKHIRKYIFRYEFTVRWILSNVSAHISNLHTFHLLFYEKIMWKNSKIGKFYVPRFGVLLLTQLHLRAHACVKIVYGDIFDTFMKNFHLVFSCGNLNFWEMNLHSWILK